MINQGQVFEFHKGKFSCSKNFNCLTQGDVSFISYFGYFQGHTDGSILGSKEHSNGTQFHPTVPKSPRLQNTDSLICHQRVNTSSELILQELSETESSQSREDRSSMASSATSNLGLQIDIGARVIFPLTYAGFVIGYFYTLIQIPKRKNFP